MSVSFKFLKGQEVMAFDSKTLLYRFLHDDSKCRALRLFSQSLKITNPSGWNKYCKLVIMK